MRWRDWDLQSRGMCIREFAESLGVSVLGRLEMIRGSC